MENVNMIPQGPKSLEKKSELAATPIFRANDLYCALFPEIKPLFERGEEPTAKKIFDAIQAQRGKAVVLDRTCFDLISSLGKVSLEDFPKEFELTEVPECCGEVATLQVAKLFQEKLQITFSAHISGTIDNKIRRELGYCFSPELVKGLLEIARQKNTDIRKVYILSEHIADHTDGVQEGKTLEVLQEEVLCEFSITAIILTTMSQEQIQNGDHIILDRHHSLVESLIDYGTFRFPEDISRQISLLPMETELHNNEQFQKTGTESKTLVKEIRKIFEKSTDSK